MTDPIYGRCPNCGEEKVWDADISAGKMHCPDCDYTRPIVREDL